MLCGLIEHIAITADRIAGEASMPKTGQGTPAASQAKAKSKFYLMLHFTAMDSRCAACLSGTCPSQAGTPSGGAGPLQMRRVKSTNPGSASVAATPCIAPWPNGIGPLCIFWPAV